MPWLPSLPEQRSWEVTLNQKHNQRTQFKTWLELVLQLVGGNDSLTV